jgi:hypothetical protein
MRLFFCKKVKYSLNSRKFYQFYGKFKNLLKIRNNKNNKKPLKSRFFLEKAKGLCIIEK